MSGTRPVLLSLSVGGGLLIVSWISLIHLGSLDGEAGQSTALMCVRIVTIVVTTAIALLLSRFASKMQPEKRWVLQLGAVAQLVFAFVGLMILPFVALSIWNHFIDFAAYPLKPAFGFMLLPTAAVIFCLTHGR
jgi:hypothetical protein